MSAFRGFACALLLVPWAGCVPRLPVEKPVEIFERDHEIEILLTSEPAGARVYGLAADGQPAELLGSTPLELARVEVRKEIWKYSESSPPDPPSRATASYQRPADGAATAAGQAWEMRIWLQADGHRARLALVRLEPQELADAYRERRWVTHVVLEAERP